MSPRHDILLRSEQTDGVLAMMDNTMDAGAPGPPLHRHDFDEAFYVIEGELTFQLEGELLTKRAGELAFAPRNVPHTLANLSDAPARYLLVITPGGFERRFDGSGPVPEVTVVGPRIGER